MAPRRRGKRPTVGPRGNGGGPLVRPLAKAGLVSSSTTLSHPRASLPAGVAAGNPPAGATLPRSTVPAASRSHAAAAASLTARQKSLASLLAGGTAGTLSATLTCPMEVVKTQLQSASRAVVTSGASAGGAVVAATPVRRSAISVARSIAATQGPAGFFRGLPPTLIGILPARATYFWAYSTVKGALGPALGDSSLVHVASAVAAGVVSNTITNPIWLLKTRMQLQAGALAAAEAAAAAGATSAVGAAVAPSATAAAAATATTAMTVTAVAAPVPVMASVATTAAAATPSAMAAGGGAVASSAAVSALPTLSVVKAAAGGGAGGVAAGTAATSLRTAAAAGATGAAGVAVKPYASYADGIRTIYRTEGIRGFYKGLTASYWGVTETALHFVVYEALKKRVAAHNVAAAPATGGAGREGADPTKAGQLSSLQLLCTAATSKLFASACTYPHEVIRTRLREQPLTVGGIPKYRSMIQAFRLIAREEGRAGLYAGVGPHLLRVVPNTALMFLVYESVMRAVDRAAVRRQELAVAADAAAAASASAAAAAAIRRRAPVPRAEGGAGRFLRGLRRRGGRLASSRFFA
ncbi:hypothetical protein MMPV_002780 [Pyropia vietnamensis]